MQMVKRRNGRADGGYASKAFPVGVSCRRRAVSGVVTGLVALLSAAVAAPVPTGQAVVLDTLNENIRYGVAGPRGRVLDKEFFVVNYRDSCRIPYWAAYVIVAESLYGRHARLARFRTDRQVPSEFRSRHDDYTGTGFDRGHLAPAELFQRSDRAYASTYVCSNICPEHKRFNEDKWRTLEAQVHALADAQGRAWVVTGTAFLDTAFRPLPAADYRWIPDGKRRVAVPTHVYDAVLAKDRSGRFTTYAFLLPNKPRWRRAETSASFLLPVDRLEEILGMDFFPALPDSIEASCERANPGWQWGR